MWRTEVGDVGSPGCYFHQQVLGQSDSPPFPHGLSVPRLPSVIVTPMAVLEFLLGELFQDEWAKHVSRETDDTRFWQSTQRDILLRLLDWKKRHIQKCVGSPWMALKRAKPEAADGLFVQ